MFLRQIDIFIRIIFDVEQMGGHTDSQLILLNLLDELPFFIKDCRHDLAVDGGFRDKENVILPWLLLAVFDGRPETPTIPGIMRAGFDARSIHQGREDIHHGHNRFHFATSCQLIRPSQQRHHPNTTLKGFTFTAAQWRIISTTD